VVLTPYDVVVIGLGSAGEAVASRLLDAGLRVAGVESEHVGGECPFWACMPSKTLLRATEASHALRSVAGGSASSLVWSELRAYRDEVVDHLDDASRVKDLERRSGEVIRGRARIASPGVVEVGDRVLQARHVVVATGSAPVRPPIDGLDRARVWTSREVTTMTEVPGRVVVIGGGPVGVELGQLLARLGSRVDLVQRGPRLLSREDPVVGQLVREQLERDAVTVRTGSTVECVSEDTLGLSSGERLAVDVVVLGAGRAPATAGLGLENAGALVCGDGSVKVDDRCQAAVGLWAAGDVTNVGPFTHVANYQGRIVADNILGRPRRARYDGIPRVVFSDPEVASVGLTAQQARESGHEVHDVVIDLAQELARPATYGEEPRGTFSAVVDTRRDRLVGAWAVAPLASEWIHQAALVIRAQLPFSVLDDHVAQFPTFSEVYLRAAELVREGSAV
jgi:pyruvate/2-oxoglutarate dehydrogenase complex dihydrolipoamide dehydrogenase (E3) component